MVRYGMVKVGRNVLNSGITARLVGMIVACLPARRWMAARVIAIAYALRWQLTDALSVLNARLIEMLRAGTGRSTVRLRV